MGPYGASKAGVHKLTETLAAELKGAITVNAVLPSIIDTVANRASMPKADPTKWVAPKNLRMSSFSWRATPAAPSPARSCRSTDGSEVPLRRYQLRSTARNRMLRLPASAMASHSAPSPEKPMN
jgi:NAD(P)-dependent dehydrogenase (short-subunit alcohol dehydrogenase family)